MATSSSDALLPPQQEAGPGLLAEARDTAAAIAATLFWAVVAVPLLPGLVLHGALMLAIVAAAKAVEKMYGPEAEAAFMEAQRRLVFGAAAPSMVSEAILRQVAGRTECLLGAGMLANGWYRLRHAHQVLGICAADRNHPYSPLERLGSLLVVTSFSYAMAVAKDTLALSHWGDLSFSAILVALPATGLGALLRMLALWDFCATGLESTMQAVAAARSHKYLAQLITARGLLRREPGQERSSGGGGPVRGWGLFLTNLCACLEGCGRAMRDAAEAFDRACQGLVGTFFLGYAWSLSIGLFCLARYLDVESHSLHRQLVWDRFCWAAGFLLLLSPLQIAAAFCAAWAWQHWHWGRVAVRCPMLGWDGEFPPPSEPETELRAVFDFFASNGGAISQESVRDALAGAVPPSIAAAFKEHRPDAAAIARFVEGLGAGSWAEFWPAHLGPYRRCAGWELPPRQPLLLAAE